MTKIDFGHSNDINPRGSWSGIGIKPGLMLCEADYYGAIESEGNEYIIAKVTKDEHNLHPQLLDKFIVMDSIYDLYADGSGVLMLDQEKSMFAQKLENYLNSPQLKDKLHNMNDIFNNCSGIYMAPIKYRFLELVHNQAEVNITSTSITHEAFLAKQEAIKNCHRPISEMQIQLSQNYTR